MNQDDHGIGSRHMIIKYNMDDRRYYMRDLGDGSGTFVRLDQPLELRNGFIISFGYSHMAVNVYGESAGRGSGGSDRISLKFIDGPKTDQTFEFTADQKIEIGRMPQCDIRFDDTQLSRLHCFIANHEGRWILTDGDGRKQSTNGTWLFVDELFPIYDQMVFKAGQTLFQAQLVPPNAEYKEE
jgi:pSer/pThr/pTyr-binding forkhead associated (FHA) protein